MEIIIALIVVAAVGAVIYANRKAKSLDVNNDGKVDAADLTAAVQNTVAAAKEVADVNKDGKVDAEDAKVVVEKAKTGAKKAASKAKSTVKKASTRGRKPKAQQ